MKEAIQGLVLTAANYKEACRILKDFFTCPRKIIFLHIQELLNASFPKNPNISELWKFHDLLQANIWSLEPLSIFSEQYRIAVCLHC